MSCKCGKDCEIPIGPIGPQGVQGDPGDPGATGAKGDTGTSGDEVPFAWLPIPLVNFWGAGAVAPEYSIRNGFLYMRGIVIDSRSTNAPFTYQDFGFTKTVLTSVGDDGSTLIDGDYMSAKLIFSSGILGVAPEAIVPHTLLLDSMAPLSIQ